MHVTFFFCPYCIPIAPQTHVAEVFGGRWLARRRGGRDRVQQQQSTQKEVRLRVLKYRSMLLSPLVGWFRLTVQARSIAIDTLLATYTALPDRSGRFAQRV